MSQSLLASSRGQSAADSPAGPLHSPVMTVEPTWIDCNGHLNMAYYHVLFDRALDQALEETGIGLTYLSAQNHSIFTAEAHVCYLHELVAGDMVTVDTLLLGHDEKRLHFFQTLSHTDKGFVASTSEQIAIHVDMTTRKAAPFLPAALERITALAAAHADLPRPERAGWSILLKR